MANNGVGMAGGSHVGEPALAWALAELVAPRLKRDVRMRLFTKIGAGEAHAALLNLLEFCNREGVAAPAKTATALRDWIGGYAGTEIDTVFRPYVENIAAPVGTGGADRYLLPFEVQPREARDGVARNSGELGSTFL